MTMTVAATAMTFGQGQVNFNTSILGTSAKVLEAVGFAGAGTGLGNTAAGGAAGTQFLMQLYAAAGTVADSSSLVAVGVPVNSRNGLNNGGYVQESGTTTLGAAVSTALNIPFLAPGGPVTLQLRAWWAGATGNTYTSYEAAFGAGNVRLGYSPLLTLAVTGNGAGSPPTIPVDLIGLSGFQLAIPEPSSMALAGLGAASLLIFRRRK